MLKQFVWVGLGRVLGAGLQLVTMVLIARSVEVDVFGIFGAALAIGLVLQTVFDFGSNTFNMRYRAKGDSGKVASGWLLGLVGSLLMLTFSVLLAVAASSLEKQLSFAIFVALAMSVERVIDLKAGLHTADSKAWRPAVSLVLRRTLILVSVCSVHLHGLAPIEAFCVSYFLVNLLWLLIDLGLWGAPSRGGITANTLRDCFRESRNYWANSIAVQIRNVDVLLVGYLVSVTATGHYALTARLVTPLQLLPSSFAHVLGPYAARVEVGNWGRIWKPVLGVWLASVFSLLAVALTFPMLCDAFLSVDYSPAIKLVQIACVGLVAASGSQVLTSTLNGWGSGRPAARAAWWETASCLGLIVVLAPTFGAIGAVVGMAIGQYLRLILLLGAAIKVSVRFPADA